MLVFVRRRWHQEKKSVSRQKNGPFERGLYPEKPDIRTSLLDGTGDALLDALAVPELLYQLFPLVIELLLLLSEL